MSATQTCSAMATYRVDFVNKNDAGRVFLSLLKQIAHARCSDADKHFHEVRSADGEERYVGFACDCSRQQRLSGTRRADQQHAFRNSSTELLEFLRFF